MRDPIKSSDARVFVKSYTELLSLEQEKALFQSWWDSNPQGFIDFMDPENKEVKKFEGGADDVYLTRIIMSFSPIIRWAIREVASYKADEDELLSEGLLALSEAARRFAPSSHENVRFAGYAKICVKGLLQGYIMRNFFPVQFCTNHWKKKLFFSLRKLIATELHAKGTFNLTAEDAERLAGEHNVEPRDVMQMYGMFQVPTKSMEDKVGFGYTGSEEYSSTFGDSIEDERRTDDPVFEADEVAFHKLLVDRAMVVLTDREKTVFQTQVLYEKEQHRTLEDLGVEFDVSKERIRQVRIEAMRKVKGELHRIVTELNLEVAEIF